MKPIFAATLLAACSTAPVFITTDPAGPTTGDSTTGPTTTGDSTTGPTTTGDSTTGPTTTGDLTTGPTTTGPTTGECLPCTPDDSCPLGQVCFSPLGLCAQACSLLVWHEATTDAMYETPCMTGIGDCPQSCGAPPNGPGGACQPDPLLDDIGGCLDHSGAPLCQQVGET